MPTQVLDTLVDVQSGRVRYVLVTEFAEHDLPRDATMTSAERRPVD